MVRPAASRGSVAVVRPGSVGISAAFGGGAATIGVFFEKPGTDKKPGTAGFYNAAAFDKLAHEAGLYAKSLNGDAFSNEAKQKAIELIKQDLGQIDLVVYSLASPVRKNPHPHYKLPL